MRALPVRLQNVAYSGALPLDGPYKLAEFGPKRLKDLLGEGMGLGCIVAVFGCSRHGRPQRTSRWLPTGHHEWTAEVRLTY